MSILTLLIIVTIIFLAYVFISIKLLELLVDHKSKLEEDLEDVKEESHNRLRFITRKNLLREYYGFEVTVLKNSWR